jgi:hypothetical protein
MRRPLLRSRAFVRVLFATACLAAVTLPGAAGAQTERPELPASRVETFEPDNLTCKPETIEAAFRSHLRPWADQPEAVQARLRLLQGEMTRSSLDRCLQSGRMTREQADAVLNRLGLSAPVGQGRTVEPGPPTPSGTRP